MKATLVYSALACYMCCPRTVYVLAVSILAMLSFCTIIMILDDDLNLVIFFHFCSSLSPLSSSASLQKRTLDRRRYGTDYVLLNFDRMRKTERVSIFHDINSLAFNAACVPGKQKKKKRPQLLIRVSYLGWLGLPLITDWDRSLVLLFFCPDSVLWLSTFLRTSSSLSAVVAVWQLCAGLRPTSDSSWSAEELDPLTAGSRLLTERRRPCPESLLLDLDRKT